MTPWCVHVVAMVLQATASCHPVQPGDTEAVPGSLTRHAPGCASLVVGGPLARQASCVWVNAPLATGALQAPVIPKHTAAPRARGQVQEPQAQSVMACATPVTCALQCTPDVCRGAPSACHTVPCACVPCPGRYRRSSRRVVVCRCSVPRAAVSPPALTLETTPRQSLDQPPCAAAKRCVSPGTTARVMDSACHVRVAVTGQHMGSPLPCAPATVSVGITVRWNCWVFEC